MNPNRGVRSTLGPCSFPFIFSNSPSGVYRISKRGAGFLLATSAHTKEGQTKFSNFFTMSKKNFVGQRGAMAKSPLPPNTPLNPPFVESKLFLKILKIQYLSQDCRVFAEDHIRCEVMRGNVCLFYVKDKNINKIILWTLHQNRSV